MRGYFDVGPVRGAYVTFDVFHSVALPKLGSRVSWDAVLAAGAGCGSSNHNAAYYGVKRFALADLQSFGGSAVQLWKIPADSQAGLRRAARSRICAADRRPRSTISTAASASRSRCEPPIKDPVRRARYLQPVRRPRRRDHQVAGFRLVRILAHVVGRLAFQHVVDLLHGGVLVQFHFACSSKLAVATCVTSGSTPPRRSTRLGVPWEVTFVGRWEL